LGVGRTLVGRGAWLCAGSLGCFEQAVRRKAFSRALRGPVTDAEIDALRTNFVRTCENARG
jgi:predicted RNA-binding protein YlxR (DUF448 family)